MPIRHIEKPVAGLFPCGIEAHAELRLTIEAMGLSLAYSSTMATEDEEKRESATRSGRVLAAAVRAGILPRQLLTRKAFENAIAVVMAVGGSANAVLHLLAVAHAAGVSLCLDDFEEIRGRVPVLCDRISEPGFACYPARANR